MTLKFLQERIPIVPLFSVCSFYFAEVLGLWFELPTLYLQEAIQPACLVSEPAEKYYSVSAPF